jgi:hypothetical protein
MRSPTSDEATFAEKITFADCLVARAPAGSGTMVHGPGRVELELRRRRCKRDSAPPRAGSGALQSIRSCPPWAAGPGCDIPRAKRHTPSEHRRSSKNTRCRCDWNSPPERGRSFCTSQPRSNARSPDTNRSSRSNAEWISYTANAAVSLGRIASALSGGAPAAHNT